MSDKYFNLSLGGVYDGSGSGAGSGTVEDPYNAYYFIFGDVFSAEDVAYVKGLWDAGTTQWTLKYGVKYRRWLDAPWHLKCGAMFYSPGTAYTLEISGASISAASLSLIFGAISGTNVANILNSQIIVSGNLSIYTQGGVTTQVNSLGSTLSWGGLFLFTTGGPPTSCYVEINGVDSFWFATGAMSAPTGNNYLDVTFENTATSRAADGIVTGSNATFTHNDSQFCFPLSGCGGPTFPAWNATNQTSWNYVIVSPYLNTPPKPGSAPYTGYETGLWGEDRHGVGAFYFSVPQITSQPASLTKHILDSASFTVVATSYSSMSYQWKKEVGGVVSDLSDGNGISGVNTATLTITAVEPTDEAEYFVEITNDSGSVVSAHATLSLYAQRHYFALRKLLPFDTAEVSA